RLIGQGAFSRVYLAEPLGSDELTVLKIVDLDQHEHPEVLVAFIREAALLAATQSPHVVRYQAHGCTRSYAWLAMEFLAGGDLKQHIGAGLASAQTLALIRQLASGLSAIHAQGVVHCDLKPGNLLFRRPDELVMVDFGLSRQLRYGHEEQGWSGAHGTASYCSPEQLRGEPLDARTDLYSAGVILFEMLTGQKPYLGITPQLTIDMHLHAPLPRLPRRLRSWQPILDSLLAKSPAARCASAEALLDALQALD
ncbi:MAG: serine/threonine protein kinase, partial [Betaproteobacteria bacterium]|nr:serine/threonine protein kinase [Betaproteobacteria bacterium]